MEKENFSELLSVLSASERVNVYKSGISGVQKASRMRSWESGEVLCVLCWLLDRQKFLNRIHTILMEDSGRDYEVVKWFAENVYIKWKTLDGALEVCKAVIEAKNTRENNEYATALYFDNKLSPRCENFRCLREKLEKDLWGEIKADYDLVRDRRISYRVVLEKFASCGYAVPGWLGEFLIKSNDRYDWGIEGFFVPYSYNLDNGVSYDIVSYDYLPGGVEESKKTYNGLFLLSTFDKHTLIGKIALNQLKGFGRFNFLGARNFDEASWLYYSMPNVGIQSTSYGFLWQDRAVNAYFGEEDKKLMGEVLVELNKQRVYLLERDYGYFITVCSGARAILNNVGVKLSLTQGNFNF